MLRFERTLRDDPVLEVSLRALADDKPWSRALYRLVWPLGRLQEIVLRLQDHWTMLRHIRGKLALPTESDEEHQFRIPMEGDRAKEVMANLRQSAAWEDLDLVVDALKQLGSRPLLLSMPIAGVFFDRHGITREVRRDLYYERLRQLAARHAVPLLDFESSDEDTEFLSGFGSHLSEEGWKHYNAALERFRRGAVD